MEPKLIATLTTDGMIRICELDNFKLSKRGNRGIIHMKTQEDSAISDSVEIIGETLMIITKNGISILVNRREFRVTGRNTRGVRAIKLNDGDQAVKLLSL